VRFYLLLFTVYKAHPCKHLNNRKTSKAVHYKLTVYIIDQIMNIETDIFEEFYKLKLPEPLKHFKTTILRETAI